MNSAKERVPAGDGRTKLASPMMRSFGPFPTGIGSPVTFDSSMELLPSSTTLAAQREDYQVALRRLDLVTGTFQQQPIENSSYREGK